MATPQPQKKLRIVTFNVIPIAFQTVMDWAAQTDHQIVLVVTTPGPSTRRNTSYQQIVNRTPVGTDVLITTRLRRVAAPLIAALQPDLIVSASFPYRLPPEIIALPRLGAVNLHPTPLPAYRGPNPLRMIYDGRPTLGATVHRVDADFDTGPILSQREVALPDEPTADSIWATWMPVVHEAFVEGMSKAIASEPGTPQDEARASYSPEFTDEETWLDWSLSTTTLLRRTLALNLFEPVAKAIIDGQSHIVERVERGHDRANAVPGAVVERTADGFVVAVADGVVRVVANPITP